MRWHSLFTVNRIGFLFARLMRNVRNYLDARKKNVLVGSLAFILLIVTLHLLEYRNWLQSLTLEIYLGVVAVVSILFGIWAGWYLSLSSNRLDWFSPELIDLSQQEYEVLQLMAKGFSDQEIGDWLHIHPNAVKTGISKIIDKLDTTSRTEAVRKAKEQQLIRL